MQRFDKLSLVACSINCVTITSFLILPTPWLRRSRPTLSVATTITLGGQSRGCLPSTSTLRHPCSDRPRHQSYHWHQLGRRRRAARCSGYARRCLEYGLPSSTAGGGTLWPAASASI